MKLFYTLIFALASMSIMAQSTPVLSKTTATWCPNCGNYGWSFMQQMKEEFQDESAFVLGVHYLGSTLENETAEWWAENLGAFGQPQFFVNHERISVNGSNWEDQVPVALEEMEEAKSSTWDVLSVNKVDLINDELQIEVNISSLSVSDPYLNIYIFEDNVEANQSGSVSDDIHPNVLRTSMSDEHEGISISSDGNFSFTKELDPSWNRDEIGILAVIWRKDVDQFVIRASKGVSNIITRSSVDEQLDQELYSVTQDGSTILINTSEAGQQSLILSDMAGRIIAKQRFEYSIELDNLTTTAGQYLLTIEKEGKAFTQKVFLNN